MEWREMRVSVWEERLGQGYVLVDEVRVRVKVATCSSCCKREMVGFKRHRIGFVEVGDCG